MLIKKIIHRPKGYIAIITANDGQGHHSQMERTHSAPPVVDPLPVTLPEPEERGLQLVDANGQVISKEMLENFVDSSEEEEMESTESKSDSDTTSRLIFIEAPATKEARIKAESKELTIKDENGNKVSEETIRREIMEKLEREREEMRASVEREVREKIEKEIREKMEKEMKEKAEKERLEKERIEEEIRNEMREKLEKEMREKMEKEIKEKEEKSDPISGNGDFYVFRPKSSTVINTGKLVCSVKPTNTSEKKIRYTYSLEEIKSIKERKKIFMNLDKYIFPKRGRGKVSKPIPKKELDALSMFRLSMNQINDDNADKIISRIQKLNVKDVKQMEGISQFLFQKAISEPNFLQVYLVVICELKDKFRYSGEPVNEKSFFFKNLLKQCQDTFATREKWLFSNDENLNEMNYEDRMAFEATIEDREFKKTEIRDKLIGTIKFVGGLFDTNLLSVTSIDKIVHVLMRDLTVYEEVELLCHAAFAFGAKLMRSEKGRTTLGNICSKLESVKLNFDKRLRFIIEDVLETRDKKWKFIKLENAKEKPRRKPDAVLSNRFANLTIVDQTTPKKAVDPSYIKNIISDLKKSTPEIRKNLIETIDKDLSSGSVEKKYFLENFLTLGLEVRDNYRVIAEFTAGIAKMADLRKDEINSALSMVDSVLVDMCFDTPFSKNNFIVLILTLRGESLINAETYSKYKSKWDATEFNSEIDKLIPYWCQDTNKAVCVERCLSLDEIRSMLDRIGDNKLPSEFINKFKKE